MNELKERASHRCFAQGGKNEKQDMLMSVKSEKVLKLLTMETQTIRPFRRKQQVNYQTKKPKYDDVGKLISNTSFGSNPDLRMIFSPEPRQSTGIKIRKQQNKQQCSVIKDNKSEPDFDKINDNSKISSMKLLGQLQNINSKKSGNMNSTTSIEIKQMKSQNNSLKLKLQVLSLQKKQLQIKYDELQKKTNHLQELLIQKQNTVTLANNELMRKMEQNLKQKQINQCLEDIIVQLNIKIEEMLKKQQQYQEQQENRMNINYSKQQLQVQAQQLREKVFSLSRALQSSQIQSIIMTKIRHQLQKEKNTNRCLQKQNKNLKQRILNMTKANRIKAAKSVTGKKSLKKDLQYSVSFSFQA